MRGFDGDEDFQGGGGGIFTTCIRPKQKRTDAWDVSFDTITEQ